MNKAELSIEKETILNLIEIKKEDKNAVINKGELIELGTHEELMNIENSQDKTLYKMQF